MHLCICLQVLLRNALREVEAVEVARQDASAREEELMQMLVAQMTPQAVEAQVGIYKQNYFA